MSIVFSPQIVSRWQEKRWNIQDDTNWVQYNSYARDLLNERKSNLASDVKTLKYDDFVNILHEAGEKHLVVKDLLNGQNKGN